MTKLWNDVRYAFRQLRKAPAFSVTAIVTLGLGIGISAAMYAVVDGVILRPIPVPHPSQIVALGEANNTGNISSSSLPDLRNWKAESKSFQDIAWYTQKFFDLKKADGSTQFSLNYQTSPNFFSMLQVQPMLGRTFSATEGASGNQGTAVLSYYTWKTYFHADPNILGKTLALGNQSYDVIGVMPPQFHIPDANASPVVWTVLAQTAAMEQRDDGFLNAIGRLRPGVTATAARAELTGIQGNISRANATDHLPTAVALESYKDLMTGPVRGALLALLGAVLVVWLIACANIAGLLLTRMIARRREIAVRAALGARRGRIVRQFLTESLMIGICGGLLGLGIGKACLVFLHDSIRHNLARSADVSLNWHIVLLLIALSIVSAAIFGTLPALQASSADPQEALHEESRAGGTGAKHLRLRNSLIVGELALSLILLVCAGLLLRTIYALRQIHLGFNPQHLVIAELFSQQGFTPLPSGPNPQDVRETLFKPLLERIGRLPGVESAALITAPPLANGVRMGSTFSVIGHPLANAANRSAEVRAVTPDIYRTLQIRLLRGRLFSGQDHQGTSAVVVVNQAFAHEFLGSQPLGQRINLDLGASQPGIYSDAAVIGVVENTPQDDIGEPSQPEVDVDLYQIPLHDDFYPVFSLLMGIAVRTAQPSHVLIPTISRILSEMSTGYVVTNVVTMRGHIDNLLGSQILAARLLWIFAIAALLIAAAGLYGLLSYSVSQRTREIGVRISLGAQRSNIVGMVMRQALILLALGLGIGVICSFFAAQLVRSFLYGVHPHDALTTVAVVVLLALVGVVASLIPAVRATRINPTEALRNE